MRGAAAEGGGTRIIDAWLARIGIVPVFPIGLLAFVVRIMADEKTPAHGWIFRGERVEARHLIVLRHSRRVASRVFERVAAGLQQNHTHPRLGEAGGERTAASAGADNDIIAIAHTRRTLGT